MLARDWPVRQVDLLVAVLHRRRAMMEPVSLNVESNVAVTKSLHSGHKAGFVVGPDSNDYSRTVCRVLKRARLRLD